jgi:hypothetical protein
MQRIYFKALRVQKKRDFYKKKNKFLIINFNIMNLMK